MSVEDTTDIPESEPIAEGSGTPKIRVEDVTKQFGRITALDGVTLDIEDGEIFALIGDNGAGKSTLMNVLSGVHESTTGELYVDGEEVNFSNPSDARANGIETVYQDLALMNDLNIATNIFMGQFPMKRFGPLKYIDWDETFERSEDIMMGTLSRDVDLNTEVEFLSGGQRQLVAIARALAFDPEVIILDEPTSALSVEATRLVQDTIATLSEEEEITIVIVSHNIESIPDLADRIGVLYQGTLVDILEPGSTGLEPLNDLMTTGTLREGLRGDD
jgi:ABC-type sugar transport system ATPase subunit